nr:tsf [Erythrotrichia carnea]
MVSDISAKIVKELRDKTGAGMMDCKKALQSSEGNMEEAIESLRLKGLASADKKASRKAAEGLIDSYIHTGSKIGVLIEVNCETDFVARREEFQVLVKNIAMQVAACPNVSYVSTQDIPEDIIQSEKQIESKKDDIANKPDNIKEKIVEGRIQKRLKELSLVDQSFIKNQDITIEELIKQSIALLGENIQVARFQRFTLGSK